MPHSRIEEIWKSITTRCTSGHYRVGPETVHENGLIAAHLQSSHRLALASWEGLLSTLTRSVAVDSAAHADLLQLNALCDRVLSQDLANQAVLAGSSGDKAHPQLRAMVDRITVGLIEGGHARVDRRYRATPGPGYYKRYMTVAGRLNWCVEFNFEYWARFGKSLIWLSATTSCLAAGDVPALEAMLLDGALKDGRQLLIPLLAGHARSEKEALEHMLTQAAAVAERLAKLPYVVDDAPRATDGVTD